LKLTQLNEYNYSDFGDEEFEASHNPDGSKKQWPHKRLKLSDEEVEKEIIINKLETELSIEEGKLKSVKSTLLKSSESKKYAITMNRIKPLQARIKTLRQQIKAIK
jgi:hypothetical protein